MGRINNDMLCQQCQKRDATIHMTEVVNNIKKERYLCRTCAEALRGEQATSGSPWGGFFESILPGPSLFGYPLAGAERRVAHRRLICPQCGETERELRETGLLGCSMCYEIFRDLLNPVFRRVQGHTRHIQISDAAAATTAKSPRTQTAGEDALHGVAVDEHRRTEEGEKNDPEHDGADDRNGPQSEIERLRSALRAAVSREDYKEAARLRDAIHEREKETSI
jgi:protein arginine kinase activator